MEEFQVRIFMRTQNMNTKNANPIFPNIQKCEPGRFAFRVEKEPAFLIPEVRITGPHCDASNCSMLSTVEVLN